MTAKLTVIDLPGELDSNELPFALVLSGCGEATAAELDALNPALKEFTDRCGARAMLVTPFHIEVS
jgi:hypothetical protein